MNVSSYRSATAELLWLAVMASLAVLTIGLTKYGSQVHLWWSAYGVGILFALAGLASGAGSQGRFSAFGGGPNTFVRVVFIGLLAAVVLAIYRGQARYLIPVPLLVVAVLLSGSRGGLVASALATLFLLGAIYRRIGLRAIVLSIAGVGAALGLLAFGSPLGNEVRKLLAQRVVTEAIGEGNLSGRSGLYAEAIRVFLENPLFGVGASGFAQVQTVISGESHAHNLILSTLAEGGVLGGAVLALAFYACSRRLQFGGKASILAVGASAGAVFIFVAAQFSGYYFDFRLFFLFVALAGSSSIVAKSESRNDEAA
ncbi:O-antigen ligase family protein [Dietzia lutea]|nr:O-antigen ligase family protein [Dietzia lutea]